MLVLTSAELAATLVNCKRGRHANLITLQGIHSIADNETIQWCPFCGSIVTKVLEGSPIPDREPQIFAQLMEVE
ncbi:MAG: hypothetical protein WD940_01900 [Patescibacteria group bacterium]